MNLIQVFNVLPTIVLLVSACIVVNLLKEQYNDAKFNKRLMQREALRESEKLASEELLAQAIARVRESKKTRPYSKSTYSLTSCSFSPSSIQHLLIDSGESFHWNDASQTTSSCLEEELILIAQVEDVDD